MRCVFEYLIVFIPFLNNPILESQLRFTFSCHRGLGRRTGNCFGFIRIQIGVTRCICPDYRLIIIVNAGRCINNIDTICTVQDFSPGCIQINLADSCRIFRIVSTVCSVQSIEYAISSDNGII